MFKIVPVGLWLLAVISGMITLPAHHIPPKPPVVLWRVLCRYEHIEAADRRIPHYVIRNDDYGHKRECIRGRRGQPAFTVVSSHARVRRAEPVAFPNVFVGCSWGVCSAHSGLPRRVGRLKSLSLVTTWKLRERARGVWAASYDIWFDRRRHISGQARGAEIMIWLSSRGFGVNHWPVVRVHHVRYHLAHWVTRHGGKRWTYIQFNRVRSTALVRNLSVRPLIRLAERRGLIKRHWWLTSVEAGFEIWKGGVGLKTKSFSVRT